MKQYQINFTDQQLILLIRTLKEGAKTNEQKDLIEYLEYVLKVQGFNPEDGTK